MGIVPFAKIQLYLDKHLILVNELQMNVNLEIGADASFKLETNSIV